MKKAKRLSKKIITLIVCGAVILAILTAVLGLEIAFALAEKIECWTPDYEKINIRPILEKQTLTDEDYGILYKQTGLTKFGVDRLWEYGTSGKNRILSIQTDYFGNYEVENDKFGPFLCTDHIDRTITHAFLENGDILVTSSTHFSGWRIGHAGLVTNSYNYEVLQSGALGELSDIGYVSEFTDRVNFMILSPKVEQEIKDKVVSYALGNLVGKSYFAPAGVLTSKNKANKTQCAHLVWYAYKQFGIDLDCNGGLIVTPRDLANSPYMEVVQVFGFDPEKLWK